MYAQTRLHRCTVNISISKKTYMYVYESNRESIAVYWIDYINEHQVQFVAVFRITTQNSRPYQAQENGSHCEL